MTARALALCALAATWCGTALAAEWHFGAAAGMNYANLSWESQPYIYPEHRIGLAGGGYLAWEFEHNMQLRAELWYSEKGGGATYSVISSDSASGLDLRRDYRSTARLSYLEMPVFLNLLLVRGENQLGSLGVGPYFGYLLDAGLKTEMDVYSSIYLYSREYHLGMAEFRRSDFGLAANLAAYFYDFEVNVRYSVGLRPALDREFDDINSFMDPLSRVWSISVGYQIK